MNWEHLEDGLGQLKGKAKAAWERVAGGIGQVAAGTMGERTAEPVRELAGRACDQSERMVDDLTSWDFGSGQSTMTPAVKGLALVGLGAGLMYYLDPDRGRSRRALVRDQFVHTLHVLDDAVGVASRDVGNRSRGIWAEARSLPTRFMGEEVADQTLVDRVRSTMGRCVSHPSSIEVMARQGCVTLGGPILAHEVDALRAAVAAVPGVTSVEDRLEVHDQPGNIPGLQGGRDRGGMRPELFQANWSPTARLLVGTAGTALVAAGLRRRGGAQLVLGAMGAGLLVRAITNIPAQCFLGEGESWSQDAAESRSMSMGSSASAFGTRRRLRARSGSMMSPGSESLQSERSRFLQIKDIMTPNAECVRPDDSLQDAARRMRDLDVGPLPVCGDNDRLAGIITDRDIAVRAVAEGKDPKTSKVREAMSEKIIYCFEDQAVEEAARMMQERQVRRLVVLNREKRLVGIVSLGDLATETGDRQKLGEVLQDVSEPAMPRR